MKKNLVTAVLMTVATTILLGVAYPLLVTGIATVLFPANANGQLIQRDGKAIGSRIIGQAFTGSGYFHPRQSAAGNGYDAANSGGTNLGPTTQPRRSTGRHDTALLQAENPGRAVPVDLVTRHAGAAKPAIAGRILGQMVPRVARERGMRA